MDTLRLRVVTKESARWSTAFQEGQVDKDPIFESGSIETSTADVVRHEVDERGLEAPGAESQTVTSQF
jgi:hypothetical protein